VLMTNQIKSMGNRKCKNREKPRIERDYGSEGKTLPRSRATAKTPKNEVVCGAVKCREAKVTVLANP